MKPRVMSLVIFTCVVGLLIAPAKVNYLDAIFSILAVALGSGAAGALNMWYESDLDSLMSRTCLRPIPTGKLTRKQAFIFGVSTSIISVLALYFFSNLVSALVLLTTILFYVFVYTIWLKRKNSSKYSYWRSRRCATASDWMDNCYRRSITRTNYFIFNYFHMDTITFLGSKSL